MKLQSAIEYLTTYGWALLIIAIALVILFELNVFNPNYYAPKAPPGSCSVSRPYGQNTIAYISLTGVCNADLPQYVFGSQGPGIYVDVQNSSLQNSTLNLQNNITIAAWVETFGTNQSVTPYHDVVVKTSAPGMGQYAMKLDYDNSPYAACPGQHGWCLEWDISSNWGGKGFIIPGASTYKWMFLTVTKGGNTRYWYANGALLGSVTDSNPQMTYEPGNVAIGADSAQCNNRCGFRGEEWFAGLIANVQIYDTALSENSINALYQEGIGGAPIDLNDLVGWWPLNGDTTDYSGDDESGVSNSIVYFNGVWWTTYTPP